ncbi:MAG TPA: hypothetical protein VF161_06765 [Steroidobacteraceae bacterium]
MTTATQTTGETDEQVRLRDDARAGGSGIRPEHAAGVFELKSRVYWKHRRKRMTLFEALRLLAEVHTRYDDEIGFTISMGATPDTVPHDLYVEAWRVVRREAMLPTEAASTR